MKKIAEKLHIHPAWLVLVACCCFFGASMGVYGNCAALYTASLLEDLNWSYTTVTIIGATLTVSRIIATRYTNVVFRTLPIRPVLAVSLIVMMVSSMFKSVIHGVVSYTIINITIGAAGAFLLYVPVPMLINSWFVEKKDTALGIAMLSSGLMAAVLSPVFNAVMEAHGWRYATVINGIVGLAISLPAVLLVVKTPEEIGLKPYGWKEPEPVKSITSPSQVFENGHPDYDTRYSAAEKKRLFFLSAVLAMLIAGLSGMPGRLPHFATTSGIGSSVGALMLSVSQFGNMASKAVMGPLCDRFGPRKTYTASTFIVFLSFLALCFMPGSTAILLTVAFLTGISAGNNMMIYPAAVRTYSKGDEYTYYISRVSMCLTFFGTPFSLLVSQLFDRTGGYFWIFVMFTVIQAAAVILCLMMFPKKEKEH